MYKFYQDTSGAEAIIYNVQALIGRSLTSGYIKNTGYSPLSFCLGNTSYGDNIILAAGEVHQFEQGDFKEASITETSNNNVTITEDFAIRLIKINTSASPTTYKLYFD